MIEGSNNLQLKYRGFFEALRLKFGLETQYRYYIVFSYKNFGIIYRLSGYEEHTDKVTDCHLQNLPVSSNVVLLKEYHMVFRTGQAG